MRAMRPSEIHAIDWGAKPAKRQGCRAVLRGDRYSIERPEPIADPQQLAFAPHTLTAFDGPIGLPAGWARQVGLGHFRQALLELGHGRFSSFFEPCADLSQLALERPFYPAKSGGASRVHQRDVLGEDALLRKCDLATN